MADLFSNVYNRYLDWLNDQANTGGNVTNNALDTINRAQRNLWQYRAWCELVKTASLTVTNLVASLPSDYGRLISMWHDSDSDGKPDFYYYLEGRPDNGYRLRDPFTKAGGHSRTVTFFRAPSYTPQIEYQFALDDFTNVGTEYSFFPEDLLFAEAQLIHVADGAFIAGNDINTIEKRRNELRRDFEDAHQWLNADMRMQSNDSFGHEVQQEEYAMDGEMSSGTARHHEADYDDGN